MIQAPYYPGDLCPCGCEATGSKLNRFGHVALYCNCFSCRNRRNQKRGKRAQAKSHRLLGGVGFTPHDEESGKTYSVECQIEVKQGLQIPASFVKFSRLDWTREALSQAERAIPVGVQAFPTLCLQPVGGGMWLMVKVA